MKITIEDIKDFFKFRDSNVNKYDFGVAGIMGGSINYSGSVKLASMSLAALRSGCGIARVIVNNDLKDAIMPYLLEQTLFVLDNNLSDAIKNLDSLAVGMGWGSDISRNEYLEYILFNYKGKLIIDADGLNILSKNLDWLSNTKARVILTPHLKEFSRLTGISVSDIKENPQKLAEEFAKKYHVILLLKGPTTIITDGISTYLVDSGSPGMATAGSGDVLSGILAGFLAYNSYDTLVVAGAAYLAGLAGSIASLKYTDVSSIASDQIKCIPDAIKIIRNK